MERSIQDILKSSPFNNLRDKIKFDFNIGKICWFKCGGIVSAFFQPKTEEDLITFLSEFPYKDKIYPLGACSNVLVRDGGIDGVVIKLGGSFTKIEIIDGYSNKAKDQDLVFIKAKSGAMDVSFSRFCMEKGISGFEFLNVIPGTIGGAISMNAGCYKKEIKDVIREFTGINFYGEKKVFKVEDVKFDYRKNNAAKGIIITEGIFAGKKKNSKEIEIEMSELKEKKDENQPTKVLTSGSTFINPEGKKAWQLIDEVGLRGFKYGGAEISTKHTNFLINTGNATSNDIEKLIEITKSKVLEKFGIDLKLEIKVIGKKK